MLVLLELLVLLEVLELPEMLVLFEVFHFHLLEKLVVLEVFVSLFLSYLRCLSYLKLLHLQDRFVEFKDFSRIYYKIQGLCPCTVSLVSLPASSAAISFTFSWDERQTFAKWPLLLHLTHVASLAGHF